MKTRIIFKPNPCSNHFRHFRIIIGSRSKPVLHVDVFSDKTIVYYDDTQFPSGTQFTRMRSSHVDDVHLAHDGFNK